ncbi:hypothetical protein SAMN05421805_1011124 [Saccharopolyspora antimicrobica]|uniref:Uncharacterized protein n=1 Tax=Saccharopolyspora antimicrobica TaxID=455193 RepID=A0A1I4SS79_9PSEU|nr:hypothetical protein [Saccharopolyspora antimicrobica]RKT86021.1 hypothetical protein ATL45_4379 [Saccharopolyspora antimicrobica]SFM67398.1 hypothetical protein SAMN05421805_1011124 [Saccharopolyspora antimicrobica]
MTKQNTCRALTAAVLTGAALLGAAPAAIAEAPRQDGVAVVDEPDTSELNNKWTFAPLGVPVFGLIDSLSGVPKRLGLI